MGIEWEKAVRLAQDRDGWRDIVETLCATWHLEVECMSEAHEGMQFV